MANSRKDWPVNWRLFGPELRIMEAICFLVVSQGVYSQKETPSTIDFGRLRGGEVVGTQHIGVPFGGLSVCGWEKLE